LVHELLTVLAAMKCYIITYIVVEDGKYYRKRYWKRANKEITTIYSLLDPSLKTV